MGDPNVIWDAAREGYWVRESGGCGCHSHMHDSCGGCSTTSYRTIQAPPEGSGIIRRTVRCEDDCGPDIVVVKKVKEEVVPPPVIMVPPPQIYLMSPPEKKPCGPTTFFPLVRNKPYQLETQQKSSCVTQSCCPNYSCGPCGGASSMGRPCPRCASFH